MIDNSKSPYFVRLPIDRYVVAHQKAIIKARISATPKPQIQWYKNMKPIFSGTRIKICHYEPDTYTLEIADVTMEDMALYTCIVRNCNGRATASASINVVKVQIEKYPKFLKRLASTSICIGGNGKLEVRATGVPQVKVKWYKDFKPLKEDQHIKIHYDDPDTYAVNIHNALPGHSGFYTCKAINDAGFLETSAMVHVEKNIGVYKLRPYIPIPCLLERSEVEKRFLLPIRADAGREEKNRFFHRLKYGYVSANDFRIHKLKC